MAISASFPDLEQTANVLADGFQTLLSEVEILIHKEHSLKKRLDLAFHEYRKLALNPAPIVSDPTNRRDVLQKMENDDESLAKIEVPLDQIAERYDLKAALDACRSLKKRYRDPQNVTEIHDAPTRTNTTDSYLERDFTSRNGTPSNLECPFAKMANGKPPDTLADPIAAEFHGDGSLVSGPASTQHNPNKCPIRYLDQHSPEEVAKYFENHKHEIPRSHAVCVSRYQQNDAKIRQLDAKYGDLQHMIQSLGAKHQQYLPTKESEQEAQREPALAAPVSVKRWAENVSQKPQEPPSQLPQPAVNGVDEEREGRRVHVETPLREIRVGESPTRPWGISVPAAQEAAESAMPSDKGIEPLALDPVEESSVTGAKGQKKINGEVLGHCPFGHGKRHKEPVTRPLDGDDLQTRGASSKEDPARPQMVFNGPVFFGYSAEETAALVKLGLLGSSSK